MPFSRAAHELGEVPRGATADSGNSSNGHSGITEGFRIEGGIVFVVIVVVLIVVVVVIVDSGDGDDGHVVFDNSDRAVCRPALPSLEACSTPAIVRRGRQTARGSPRA